METNMTEEKKQAILDGYKGKTFEPIAHARNGAIIIGQYVDEENMLWYVIVLDGVIDLVSASRYPVILDFKPFSVQVDSV